MKDFDEMRNIDLEQDPDLKPKKEKKKGGFLGKFIACLLGLILGIVATIGGIGFFGWYVYAKMPIEKGTDKVNGILGTDIDYSQYIDASYGEKTISHLVGDVIDAVDKVSASEGTFNTLNAISPLVGKLVKGEDGTGGLVGTLAAFAITLDPEQTMNKILVKPSGTPEAEENKDVYLVDYVKYCFDNAPLGDMLKAFGYDINEVIQTICYGVEGVDYVKDENGEIQMINGATKLTVGEFLGAGLDEQIQNLPIESFITISFPNDAVMCMLAYGAEYRYEKTLDENGNVVMTQVFYEGSGSPFTLKDDEGNDVTANIVSGADNPQNGIVLNHVYTKNDQEITETRYLQYNATDGKYYAFEDAEYTKPIKFKKNTIGMLSDGSSNLIDKMFVKDLLNIDHTDERVMIALCYGKEGTDWKFDENGEIEMLGTAKPRTVKDLKEKDLFSELTLKDILGEDVETNMILHSLAGTSVKDLPTAMNELTFDDIFPEQIYEYEKDASDNFVLDADGNKIPVYVTDENGEQVQKVSAMWNYLFDDPTTTHVERPNEYYLLGHDISHPGVDQMVENMQKNMQTATLEKLVRDDLIVFEGANAAADKEKFLTDTTQKKLVVNGVEKYVRELTIIEMITWAIS